MELALRLVGAFHEYMLLRGSLDEDRQWLEEVLHLKCTRKLDMLRARALYGAGALALMRNDLDLARRRLTECQELARAVNDNYTLALALGQLARLELYPGNYAAARALVDEGLQVTEGTNHKW